MFMFEALMRVSFICQTIMSDTVKRALLEALAADEFMMRNHRTYVVNLQEVKIAWRTY